MEWFIIGFLIIFLVTAVVARFKVTQWIRLDNELSIEHGQYFWASLCSEHRHKFDRSCVLCAAGMWTIWSSDQILCRSYDKIEYLYVVVVRYITGDTFGASFGNGVLAGAFVDQGKAVELKDKILAGDDKYEDCCRHACSAWVGYFEGVEDCYIEHQHIYL